MKNFFFIALLSVTACFNCAVGENAVVEGYAIPGFVTSPYFGEQVMAYDYAPGVKVEINAPSVEEFDPSLPTGLVLYALPDGNSTDWTIGKKEDAGGNWHYQIQHIGAQTRFVRSRKPGFNLVTVYLEAEQRSWGAWRKVNMPGSDNMIKELTESLLRIFDGLNPYIVLVIVAEVISFSVSLTQLMRFLPM